MKQRIEKQQNVVFAIFGSKCQRCGIEDPDVLCIDHIEPIGKNRRHVYQIYPEIIKNPEESKKKYQLLCHNCNWKKMLENNEHHNKLQEYATIEDLQSVFYLLEQRINILDGISNKIYSPKSTNLNQAESLPLVGRPEIRLKVNREKLIEILLTHEDELVYTTHGKPDIVSIKTIIARELKKELSTGMAYEISRLLHQKYPEVFNH